MPAVVPRSHVNVVPDHRVVGDARALGGLDGVDRVLQRPADLGVKPAVLAGDTVDQLIQRWEQR